MGKIGIKNETINNNWMRFMASGLFWLHLPRLYSGYHKNWIQLSFYYTLFHGKYTKTIVWNAGRFYLCLKKKGQTHQAAASLEAIHVLALFSQRCAVRTAHGIICRYNWIADYTIIILVHKITWILKISRGPSANQNAYSEYNVQ